MNYKKLFLPLPALFLILAFNVSNLNAQIIRGQVVEEFSAEPVPGAVVLLMDMDSVATKISTTDGEGHYELKVPKPGIYMVSVQKMDYLRNTSSPFRITKADTANFEIRVISSPQQLDAITVTAKQIFPELEKSDFYKRKDALPGIFLDRYDIYKNGAIRSSELFRQQTGFSLNNDGEIINTNPRFLDNTNCRVTLFIDNLEVTNLEGVTVDLLIPSTDQIVGIEIYKGIVGLPARFRRNARGCGAIVIWTRNS